MKKIVVNERCQIFPYPYEICLAQLLPGYKLEPRARWKMSALTVPSAARLMEDIADLVAIERNPRDSLHSTVATRSFSFFFLYFFLFIFFYLLRCTDVRATIVIIIITVINGSGIRGFVYLKTGWSRARWIMSHADSVSSCYALQFNISPTTFPWHFVAQLRSLEAPVIIVTICIRNGDYCEIGAFVW